VDAVLDAISALGWSGGYSAFGNFSTC
jgi:hypothetical protein